MRFGEVSRWSAVEGSTKKSTISNAGSGTVTKIDSKTWEIVGSIAVGKGPEHLELSPDGKTLFVVNVIDSSVSVVNLSDAKVHATYGVGRSPHGVSASTDGKYLFVSGKGDDTLTRVILATGETTTMPIAPKPYHVAYIRGVERVYVTSRGEPKIWVVNPNALTIESTIDMGSGVAHQIVSLEKR